MRAERKPDFGDALTHIFLYNRESYKFRGHTNQCNCQREGLYVFVKLTLKTELGLVVVRYNEPFKRILVLFSDCTNWLQVQVSNQCWFCT